MDMRTISISGFKARCLRLLDELDAGGEPIVVTKRGRPIARVLPFRDTPAGSWLGTLRGTAAIRDDLVEPVVGPDEWEALRS
jgi:prevent-host-death family protein